MSSDDHSREDKKKRKAELEGGYRVFEKSKKTARSPPTPMEGEEKLDQILSLVKELSQSQRGLKDEIRRLIEEQKQHKEKIETLERENVDLKREYKEIKTENTEIKIELREAKYAIECLERDKRQNSLVINGIDTNSNNRDALKENIEKFVEQHLEVDATFKTITRLGPKTCVIQLDNMKDKTRILENKSKLKYLAQKVYINEYLTKSEMEKQKIIREKANEEKQKGKMVNIGYNKIIIDGEEWRWNRNTRILEKTKSKN